MNGVKLTYQEVETIATQLQTSADNMNGILENIKVQFNQIGDETVWSGTSASQTKAIFDELSAKFPDFVAAVESCCTFLTTTVIPSYKEVEATITGTSFEN